MKQVNIIIGRFQPFTYGHMKCVEVAWNRFGIPTILVMIHTKEDKVDNKHPFPSSMLIPIYNDILGNGIEKIVQVRTANIIEIGELLYNEGYEIRSWSCGTDRLKDYKRMSVDYHDQAHLADDFELIEISRDDEDISATKARQALLDEDINTFMSLTPFGPPVYNALKDQLLKACKKI